MNNEQLETLKMNAKETLAVLDLDNLTKDSFLLAGSALAILDHGHGHCDANSDQSESAGVASSEEKPGWIDEELSDASKYHDMYIETHDPDYLEMAKDEMRHAQILLTKARERGEDVEKYRIWLNSVAAKLS